ncbi:cytochrome P450 [Mycena rosella]|uniref:Cytochrome P450 n=1 Tax=Mycena rosella TaxID=1033263 RepID=A0AAD7F843_MYCRO|nr:cytochrome P450 [Mycena rosella]
MPRCLYAAASLCLVVAFRAIFKRRELRGNHPPIIDIPASEIFNNPREAYEKALKDHGPVIGVRRKGFLEFIVDPTLVQTVLTSDQSFSFEEAMATVLHLRPFVSFFWSFFREIDDLVQNGINPRMSNILERICPVFNLSAEKSIGHGTIDMFEHAHTSIAEAMIILIFGEGYVNERNIRVVTNVATDIAGLTGMYQNSSALGRHFPTIWSICTWVKVICTSILAFFRIIGPQVWRQIRSRRWVEDGEKPTNVLEYLSYKHAKNGTVSPTAFLWIMSLLMGASVVVWVVFELATRPEYLKQLREEVHSNVDPEAVQKATCTCRMTTADTPLGGYTIPKGFLVFPLATLVHLNPVYHPDPPVFRPERWQGADARPAVMSSASYIPFGLARWSCPGKILAVSGAADWMLCFSIYTDSRLS